MGAYIMKNLLHKKPTPELFAEVIAEIITWLIMSILGFLWIVAKLLKRFSKWEWRLLVLITVLSFLYINLQFFADAPKAQAVLDTPITTPKAKPILSLYEQHRQYIESVQHGDILLRVWDNETSQGKNINLSDKTDLAAYCKRQGLTNEFGYNPQAHQCFQTFNESVDTVNRWFNNCLHSNTLSECLESYSGNSNSYISKFLNQ